MSIYHISTRVRLIYHGSFLETTLVKLLFMVTVIQLLRNLSLEHIGLRIVKWWARF